MHCDKTLVELFVLQLSMLGFCLHYHFSHSYDVFAVVAASCVANQREQHCNINYKRVFTIEQDHVLTKHRACSTLSQWMLKIHWTSQP